MGSFEQLRKEARALENEIDSKLISYSKFGASFAQSSFLRDDSASDSTALLNGDHVSSAMGQEIEQLLLKLSEVNENMGKITDNATSVNYITNHRTKLHEYSQEFKRIKTQINAAREHAELLISVRQDISQYKNSLGSSRQENLLRERGSIHNADKLADNLIGQAIDVKENLTTQRGILQGTLFKIKNVSKAFPGISRAISLINRRKKRDLFILSAFVALCLCLLLLFIFKRG